MVLFKEYWKKDPILNPRMQNGKDPNRVGPEKKTLSVVPKTYSHKDSAISKINQNRLKEQLLQGQALMSLLAKYDTDFEIGEKVLGNSNVKIRMFVNGQGIKTGIISSRD